MAALPAHTLSWSHAICICQLRPDVLHYLYMWWIYTLGMNDRGVGTCTLTWHTLSLNGQLARCCQSTLCCLDANGYQSEPLRLAC